MVLEHNVDGHDRKKRETMMLMQENNEKLKSKGARHQSFRVDVKRGDGSSKRKGHQSTPPDCLRGLGRKIDLTAEGWDETGRRAEQRWARDPP